MTVGSRVLGGRYRLGSVVGQGGMAVVYRAEDLTLGRVVAVKILREALGADPELLERFDREAKSAGRLNHPNIIAVYDVGTEGDSHFMVMEYVEGTDLRDLIRDHGALSPERVVHIGCQIAAALEYAHRNDVVHRDIKSQNVLVTPEGRVKVADFGIAVTLGERSITQTGMVIGSVHYMAPEQAEGRPTTTLSDVYSLGIVLYEMATGQLPFSAESPVAIAHMQLEAAPTPPQVVNPLLPTPLADVILACIEKDPARRPASAALVAAALRGQRTLASQSTSVMPAVERDGRGGATARRQKGSTGRQSAGGTERRPRPAPADDIAPVDGAYTRTELLPAERGLARRPAGYAQRRAGGSRFWPMFWLTLVLGTLAATGGWLLAGRTQLATPSPTAAPVLVATAPPTTTRAPAATKPAVQPTAPPATAAPPPATATPQPQPSATPVPQPTVPPSPPTSAPTSPPAKPTAPVGMSPVPDVMSLSQDEATKKIQSAGLTVTVAERPSVDGRDGVVVGQDPRGGTQVLTGSTVTITIGRGRPDPPKPAPKPGLVLPPNVEGMPEAEARRTLEGQGFQVKIDYDSEPRHKGVVINQIPNKNESVRPGSVVKITIGQ